MAVDPFSAEVKEIEIDPTKDYLPELVGEDKKFKTPQDLARSVLHKDSHIARIERENAELREDLTKRANMQELVDQMTTVQKNLKTDGSSNELTTNREPPEKGIKNERADAQNELKPFSREDVLKVLEEERRKAKREANLLHVQNKLAEQFGENTPQAIDALTKKLSVNKEWLQDMAAQSPEAFLTLMAGEAPKKDSVFSGVKGSVNTGSFMRDTGRTDGRKTFKEWQALRAKDPSEYHRQYSKMHDDAKVLREEFYS